MGRRTLTLSVVMGLLFFGLVMPASADGPTSDESALFWFADGVRVQDGATTTLARSFQSVSVDVDAEDLVPGNAYTAWIVVFNSPNACSDSVCGEDDIFVGGDPTADLNLAGIEDAQISVLWAGIGGVADSAGHLGGQATIAPGDYLNTVLFGPGLLDPVGAEIHVVIRDHGPASSDPATLERQTTTFNGGCTDDELLDADDESFPCEDVQFSIHLPSGNLFADDNLSEHEPAIQSLALAGISMGSSPTTYSPYAALSRGEMAALIARAMHLPPSSQDWFADDDGHPFESYINSLAEDGITEGTSLTTYSPDGLMTRGQIAAFLARGLGLSPGGVDRFDDDDGHPFEGYINALAQAGITSGTSATTYSPDALVTRAEAASFIGRAFLLTPVPAGELSKLYWFADGSKVDLGAKTVLTRTPENISLTVHSTELVPGNAYTAWIVVFNSPNACSDSVCGEDDIFVGGDPTADLNLAGIEAAQISVLWAGIGGVAETAFGNLGGQATIAPGDYSDTVLFGPGLLDPVGAEIHVVIRDHGPASSDPATLERQTTTFNGGCTDDELLDADDESFPCEDVQFSIHGP